MRFGTQQAIVIVPITGLLMLTGHGDKLFGAEKTWEIPVELLAPIMLLYYAALFRYLFWLAWASDRGDGFFRAVGFSRTTILSGTFSRVLRFYCHIDKNGTDLDAAQR